MAGRAYRTFLERIEGLRTLGVDLGLDRVRQALTALGEPQRRVPAVQIAGTNGKGSTAAMAEAVLRAAGLRAGLFTSPHLNRFTERVRIGGQEVDGDRLAALDESVAATGVPLTYFEVSAVLAFLCLAEEKAEVAVLETGLGGRLDAVTACQPLATAITGISVDHAELLGGTLREIAREKAGIAKPGVPLYLGPMPSEAADEIGALALATGAPVRRFGVDFQAPDVPIGLAGAHQRSNAAIAVALAREACANLGRPLSEAAIREGLASVRWPGRLEWIPPGVLLDCAHNLEGAEALAAALEGTPRPRALVVSIVRGKDAAAMMAALVPRFDAVIATGSRSDRAISPTELAGLAPGAIAVADPLEALAEARRQVGPAGLVVVAGSIFLVGQVRGALLGEAVDPVTVSDPMP